MVRVLLACLLFGSVTAATETDISLTPGNKAGLTKPPFLKFNPAPGSGTAMTIKDVVVTWSFTTKPILDYALLKKSFAAIKVTQVTVTIKRDHPVGPRILKSSKSESLSFEKMDGDGKMELPKKWGLAGIDHLELAVELDAEKEEAVPNVSAAKLIIHLIGKEQDTRVLIPVDISAIKLGNANTDITTKVGEIWTPITDAWAIGTEINEMEKKVRGCGYPDWHQWMIELSRASSSSYDPTEMQEAKKNLWTKLADELKGEIKKQLEALKEPDLSQYKQKFQNAQDTEALLKVWSDLNKLK